MESVFPLIISVDAHWSLFYSNPFLSALTYDQEAALVTMLPSQEQCTLPVQYGKSKHSYTAPCSDWLILQTGVCKMAGKEGSRRRIHFCDAPLPWLCSMRLHVASSSLMLHPSAPIQCWTQPSFLPNVALRAVVVQNALCTLLTPQIPCML